MSILTSGSGIIYPGMDRQLASEQRFRRMKWLREHCFVQCPHCKIKSPLCFSEVKEAKDVGLLFCRVPNCEQAHSLEQNPLIVDRWNQEITGFPPGI